MPASVTCSRMVRRQIRAVPPDAARRSRGRRRDLAQAPRPRRDDPPGQRRAVELPPGRLARAREDRPDHPRGDGRDRRPGDVDAGDRARRAVGEDGPLRGPRALQARRPRRSPVRALDDARGDGDVPLLRARLLPRPAEDALPLPDEGPRRAAPARRPASRARVRDEGRVLVRPRRGRASTSASRSTPARTSGSSSAAASRPSPCRPSRG